MRTTSRGGPDKSGFWRLGKERPGFIFQFLAAFCMGALLLSACGGSGGDGGPAQTVGNITPVQLTSSHDGWNSSDSCLSCHDGTTACLCHQNTASLPQYDWDTILPYVAEYGGSSCVVCHGNNTDGLTTTPSSPLTSANHPDGWGSSACLTCHNGTTADVPHLVQTDMLIDWNAIDVLVSAAGESSCASCHGSNGT